MRHRLILAIVFVLALAVPSAALAATEVEPNDGIEQADGPLTAGTNFDGTLSSSPDVDWYVLYVSGQGQLDLTLTNRGTCCDTVTAYLLDHDGGSLNSASAYTSSGADTDHVLYTTPGAGVYYVYVTGDVDDPYRLRATGPLTGGSRPGPGQVTPNDNPTRESAYGPLLGSLYEGRIDADGEQDWFYFYTNGAGTFDVTLTALRGGRGCCPDVGMELHDRDGETLNSDSAYSDSRAHIVYTGSGPDAFYLRLSGDTEESYQLQITPAELLTTTVPPFLTAACQQAEANVTKLKNKLAKAKARVAAATTRKAKQPREEEGQAAQEEDQESEAGRAAGLLRDPRTDEFRGGRAPRWRPAAVRARRCGAPKRVASREILC